MLPINHLKRTLDRCCGQWEFRYHSASGNSTRFEVEFLNTHDYYVIYHRNDEWTAELANDDATICPRLTGILNGHQRNDAGDLPSDFACVPGVE